MWSYRELRSQVYEGRSTTNGGLGRRVDVRGRSYLRSGGSRLAYGIWHMAFYTVLSTSHPTPVEWPVNGRFARCKSGRSILYLTEAVLILIICFWATKFIWRAANPSPDLPW